MAGTRTNRKFRRGRRRAPSRQVFKWQLGLCGIGVLALLCMDLSGISDEHLIDLQPINRYLPSRQAVIGHGSNGPPNLRGGSEVMGRMLGGDDESDFPKDLFDKDQLKNGAILIHFVVMCYMFSALAIVCDVFFEGALEAICATLDISEDVAGASFMAAGGSAPELFTSIIGTFVTKSDIGFGTIVGSAVFNVLFVIGVCGLFAGSVLALSWYPLSRDSTYYTITLIVLVMFVEDNEIFWYEACILFMLYLGYLYIMRRNEDLKAFVMGMAEKYKIAPSGAMDSKQAKAEQNSRRESTSSAAGALQDAVQPFSGGTGGTGSTDAADPSAAEEAVVATAAALAKEAQKSKSVEMPPITAGRPKPKSEEDGTNVVSTDEEDDGTKATVAAAAPAGEAPSAAVVRFSAKSDSGGAAGGGDDGDLDDDEDEEYMVWPENDKFGQLMYIIMAPLKLFMLYTIPNAEEKPKLYMVSFGMSIVHIALYSYFMVWMADTIGRTLDIPTPVMGVTVLAGGTSIPDALSSLAVAKRGFGDMAVSSSIGSNVFDITVGLPFPWMLWCLAASFDDDPSNDSIVILSDTLWLSVSTLLLMLFVTVASIHFGGWQLSTRLSVILVLLYFVFVTEALLLEYGVIEV